MSSVLAEFLKEAAKECGEYETCMCLEVNTDGSAVELCLDTGIATYSEWIPGEGADIALIRCMETNRVVGCRLPLLKQNLAVFHNGPLRVNDGFSKGSSD